MLAEQESWTVWFPGGTFPVAKQCYLQLQPGMQSAALSAHGMITSCHFDMVILQLLKNF